MKRRSEDDERDPERVQSDPSELDYSMPTDASRVRELLAKMGLGQRAAARELDINERTMRDYCAGKKVPRVVILALERLVDLQRRVAGKSSNQTD
jgi:DNA-binding XRE family transcriptional regulator